MNLAADYQSLFLAMAHKMSVRSQYTKHGVESLLDDLERFTDKRLRGRRRRKAFDAINLIRENYDQDTARLTMATIDPDYTVDELFEIYSDCQVFLYVRDPQNIRIKKYGNAVYSARPYSIFNPIHARRLID